jgi:hypothetical protein
MQTEARLTRANKDRARLARQVAALQAQAERLSRLAVKNVNVDNRCSSAVRAAMRFRAEDGTWTTYSFWNFPPGLKARLQIRDSVDARVTWNLTYVYAESADHAWVYQGTNGEVEKVQDATRQLTMKAWFLPVDNDANYSWVMCE